LRILYYPTFSDQSDLNDQHFRALWYLAPFEGASLVFGVDAYLTTHIMTPPMHFDPIVEDRNSQEMFTFEYVPLDTLDAQLADADAIMVWDQRSLEDLRGKLRQQELTVPVWRVDPMREQFEGSFYLRASSDNAVIRDPLLEAAHDEYAELVATHSADKVYLLGTGPSVKDVDGHDFSDGLVVSCNSIVNNDSLLPQLTPEIIVATDPIFHSGPSSYAAAFRARLQEAMRAYGSTYVPLFRDLPVHLAWAPDSIRDRIIGIPADRSLDSPNLDLTEHFGVYPTSNVLTLMMIPLVGAFAKQIVIGGCDGRPLDQNDYFWKHDPASQFVDEMANIRAVHPAFFSEVDYDDYYLQHIELLERMLAELESRGVEVVNMTQSHIPALACRTVLA